MRFCANPQKYQTLVPANNSHLKVDSACTPLLTLLSTEYLVNCRHLTSTWPYLIHSGSNPNLPMHTTKSVYPIQKGDDCVTPNIASTSIPVIPACSILVFTCTCTCTLHFLIIKTYMYMYLTATFYLLPCGTPLPTQESDLNILHCSYVYVHVHCTLYTVWMCYMYMYIYYMYIYM